MVPKGRNPMKICTALTLNPVSLQGSADTNDNDLVYIIRAAGINDVVRATHPTSLCNTPLPSHQLRTT